LDAHTKEFPVGRRLGVTETASVQHIPIIDYENIPDAPVHGGHPDLFCAMRDRLCAGFALLALWHHAALVKPDEASGRTTNGRVKGPSAVAHEEGSRFEKIALLFRGAQVAKAQ
jgi:hypothetical protein